MVGVGCNVKLSGLISFLRSLTTHAHTYVIVVL